MPLDVSSVESGAPGCTQCGQRPQMRAEWTGAHLAHEACDGLTWHPLPAQLQPLQGHTDITSNVPAGDTGPPAHAHSPSLPQDAGSPPRGPSHEAARSPTQLTGEGDTDQGQEHSGAGHISLGTAAGPGMVGSGGAGRQRTISAGWGERGWLAGGEGSQDQTG